MHSVQCVQELVVDGVLCVPVPEVPINLRTVFHRLHAVQSGNRGEIFVALYGP